MPTCRLPEVVLPPDGRLELFVVVRGSIGTFVVIVGLTSTGGGGAGWAVGGERAGGVGCATAMRLGIGATM